MKRIRRGTIEASSSRPNRQRPTASARRQRAAPQDHIEDTTEVEDVVPTDYSNVDAEVEDVATAQDSNVEVHAEPTEPSRVGPIDPSLLTSFKTHIIATIWNNQEREPLRCMSKTSTLREWNWWGNPNNGIFKGYIQRSGLEPLIRCSYRNADKIVVSTFVERWHPETNTFHMPFGEMTITLDDVSSILGIPVSGVAVAPLGDDDDTNFELLVKYLGVTDEKATKQLHKYSDEYVSLSWLRARFSNVSDTDSEEYIMYSARAYLLYLLGCTLFVDKIGTRVQIVYLRLLRNLDSIAGYSWGSGCLAWLYRQLGQASRSKVKQIAGYMTLLEAWVYEHMYGVVVLNAVNAHV
ncbi:unnamed protein product [Prunus armeniaca]